MENHKKKEPTKQETLEWGTLEYLQAQLETLVDDYGIQNVIEQLSVVCAEKAHHLAVYWQDYRAQVQWQFYADCIATVTFHLFPHKGHD